MNKEDYKNIVIYLWTDDNYEPKRRMGSFRFGDRMFGKAYEITKECYNKEKEKMLIDSMKRTFIILDKEYDDKKFKEKIELIQIKEITREEAVKLKLSGTKWKKRK